MTQQAYFVTGTDTGVGKTLIASALVHMFAQLGYKSVGMKPIAAGCEFIDGEWQNEDVIALEQASNVSAPKLAINPYKFKAPIAPHIAANMQDVQVDLNQMIEAYEHLKTIAEVVIVEGAGGFCVPLNDTHSMADLAKAINLPIILVVGMRLGCLNHALLTVEAVERRGLRVAGWVANCMGENMPMLEENIASLNARIDAPCLGVVPSLTCAEPQATAQFLNIQSLS